MAEKYGVENLKKLLVATVDGAMVIDKVINKEGLFSIFQFTQDFLALSNLDVAQVRQEVSDLSAAERVDLETVLKTKLVLHDKALQVKIDTGVDLIEASIGLLAQILDLVDKVKALLQP